jgi:hypothetical protein
MKITKKTNLTYWWTGTIFEPGEDGAMTESTVKLKFKRVARNSATDEKDVDILKKLIVDWDLVTDDDGKVVPFTQESLAEVLKDQFTVANFIRIYFDAFTKARSGN